MDRKSIMDDPLSSLHPLRDEALQLAEQAEREGNLPIGAVIALNGEVIARGRNAIWRPRLALSRHAETEAILAVPADLWARAAEMTLVTTLEPCLMCAGAILLHRIGRVVFGSTDPAGGAGAAMSSLPPYFAAVLANVEWIGPAFPETSDPLYHRVMEIEARRRSTVDASSRRG